MVVSGEVAKKIAGMTDAIQIESEISNVVIFPGNFRNCLGHRSGHPYFRNASIYKGIDQHSFSLHLNL